MEKKIQAMKIHKLIHIATLFFGVALLPETHAINPAPDGCYPNSTTAEGCKVLQSLTSGIANTGIGWYSLFATDSGSYNTAVGAGALDLNTADNNTAVGVAALLLNTTGTNNTANGVGALVFNNEGEGNTATGAFALYSNTSGQFNTANGEFALYFNTTGERNTAVGDSALYQNTQGNRNTAIGNPALLSNATGNGNTAVGAGALFSSNADGNTAVGADVLSSNTTGSSNTAAGASALMSNTTGVDNTAIGLGALANNTTGGLNTAIGENALPSNTTGGFNTAVGRAAGLNATTGNGNVYVGDFVAGVAGESNHTYIANIESTTVSGAGTDTVTVNLTTGLLGHLSSSRRYKEQIKPMDAASETLYRLKPVTYRYKKEIDPSQSLDYGLVAEQVVAVDPNLANRNCDGQIESVRYTAINAMLLNEFLKEHRTVQAQQKEIETLKQELKEQKAFIEKVSARIEMDKAAPQLAVETF